MWPWLCWVPVMAEHHKTRLEGSEAHERVRAAADDLSGKQEELTRVQREARHGDRNLRATMVALLERLGRLHDPRHKG
jgi:hypothetical protein